MWLFNLTGYYSVAASDTPGHITVRGRVKKDLDDLRTMYMPQLGPVEWHPERDYPWRAEVSLSGYKEGLCKSADDILTYTKFKTEVRKRQGDKRYQLYVKLWSNLLALEPDGGQRAIRSLSGTASKTKSR